MLGNNNNMQIYNKWGTVILTNISITGNYNIDEYICIINNGGVCYVSINIKAHTNILA